MPASDPQRIALRRLLTRFVAFAAPILVLAALAEARFRAIPTSYSVKRAWLEAHAPDVEVLVFGSSSALHGVDPEFFGVMGYNVGNVAQSIYYDHELLSRYVDSLKKLNVAMFLFDYQTLEYHFSDGVEAWRQFFYYREYGFAPEGGVDPYDVRFTSVFQLYLPKFRTECLVHRCDYTDGINAFGWAPTPTADVNDGAFWFKMDNELMHADYVSGNVDLVDRDLALLQSRNIRAALIVPPVSRSFYALARPGVRAETVATLRRLAADHGGSYYDYFEDARFGEQDFASSTHLNATGAEKFSRILDEEVLHGRPRHDAETSAAPR